MQIKNFSSITEIAEYVTKEFINQIQQKPNSIFYFATGQTQIPIYQKLVELAKESETSFKEVTAFNLDEYLGVSHDSPNSFLLYMRQHLYDSIDIRDENIHCPNGVADDATEEAKKYKELLTKAGPADICLLGIGPNGHIAFNEPGSFFDSTARVVDLTDITRQTNFPEIRKLNQTPNQAITIGISEIMASKRIVQTITGEHKLDILKKFLNTNLTTDLPATVLKSHPNYELVTDQKTLADQLLR